jgi:hypothetical protein
MAGCVVLSRSAVALKLFSRASQRKVSRKRMFLR